MTTILKKTRLIFLLVNGSISTEEKNALSKNSIRVLRRNLIPKDKIPKPYCMASVLEEWGKEIKQGIKFGGSRMVMYGMFENSQLAW